MKTRFVLGLTGAGILGGALWISRARHDAGAGGGAAAAAASARPTPVTVATVALRDVPIYLDGLGNAQPFATVTVKSQVDGRLDKVLFREGQNVKKGDLLAQVDPRPFVIQLHQAQATLLRDNAQLRNAKLNLDRYTGLRAENLIPQQQVDDQKTSADQFQASVQSDQTLVDTARLQLDYAQIKSPIDGVTGVRLVDSGNIVHAADAGGIVVITQLDPMSVMFTLPEDDLPRVSKHLAQGPITVEAYSRDGGTKLGTGQLLLIDNEVNSTTATIRLKASFPNPDKVLWPNAFVKVRLLLETKGQALVVPAAVVQRGPDGTTYAYVVGPDKTVSVRPIEVATTQDQSALIARGLSSGDQVVVEGQSQLRPNAKVAPRMIGADRGDKGGEKTIPAASASASTNSNVPAKTGP